MLFNDYVRNPNSNFKFFFQKNVKTVIFSELPQQDKIKYFNFLLENDINFSRDESGNYVALVKVLNPAFYGGAQTNVKTKMTPKDRSKKNSKVLMNEKEIKEDKKENKNQIKNVGDKNKNYEIPIDNNTSLKSKKPKINSEFFEKEKKVIKQKNFLDSFEGRYQKFIQLVNPLVGVRGKRMNINELHYCIEEIYSIRFINDSNKDNVEQSFPFPNFVLEFLTNKYIKKPTVDQHSLDLILSIDFYKTKDVIVDIFSKFLNEDLGGDDLEFYLYVRYCIEQELNTTFIELARQKNKKGKLNEEEKDKTCLTVKSCLNLANNIYGDEQEEMLNNFMNKIEEILTKQKNKGIKKNLISAEEILKFTLESYHQNKLDNTDNNKNILLKNNNINKLNTYENIQKNYAEQSSTNIEEKISRLKIILSTYIKEKELDVFFQKLLSLYMVYEKSNNNVEEILASIKDLVSKKVNLLIKILFDKDEKGWFNSLKLEETDKDGKEYYVKLTEMIDEMMKYENLKDIPENMVQNFGETLLYTPELNSQINKLVLKRFE